MWGTLYKMGLSRWWGAPDKYDVVPPFQRKASEDGASGLVTIDDKGPVLIDASRSPEAVDMALIMERSREIDALFDPLAMLIVVPDEVPDALMEPYMVRGADWAAASPEARIRFHERAVKQTASKRQNTIRATDIPDVSVDDFRQKAKAIMESPKKIDKETVLGGLLIAGSVLTPLPIALSIRLAAAGIGAGVIWYKHRGGEKK